MTADYKLSIVTCVFNGEKTIEDTILSVINQKFNNLELIIIDGLSTDSTIEIAKKYASKDKRIKVISEKDTGIYDAYNKGLKYASGDYILFLNADDFLFSNSLESVSKNMKNKYADIFSFSIAMINENDRYYKKIIRSKIDNHSINNSTILTPGIIYKKNIFEKIGNFDTMFKICADVDIIYRSLNSNLKIIYSDTLLTFMREGGISTSLKFEFLKKKEQYKAHIKNSKKLISKYFFILFFRLVKVILLNTILKQKLKIMKKNLQDKFDEKKIFWFR